MAEQAPGAMPTQPTAEAGAMPAEAPKPEGELSLEDYKRQHGEMQAALKKANKEAEAYRKAEAARQKDAEDKAAAELSEAQKLAKRAEKAEAELNAASAKLKQLELKENIRQAAIKQKVKWNSPQAEADAIDLLIAKCGADDGLDVDETLKTMLKDRPYLLVATTPAVGTPLPTANGQRRPQQNGSGAPQQKTTVRL